MVAYTLEIPLDVFTLPDTCQKPTSEYRSGAVAIR